MKKNTLTKDLIDQIIHKSNFTYRTEFGKCTVVTMQLPNGFVLSESSACVDPANYDEKLGYDICVKKLTEKVWELEGYLLQNELHKRMTTERDIMDMTIGELQETGCLIELDLSLCSAAVIKVKGDTSWNL